MTLPKGQLCPVTRQSGDLLDAEPCDELLHEIKHDGLRVIARKDGAKVRLYSRPGNDLTTASC
jgi:ATP-dependent DNA ligase